MDIIALLQGLASSETAVFAIFLILGLVYKEVIKPKMDRLKKYEEDTDERLKNLLTKDEMIKLNDHSKNDIIDDVVSKLKENILIIKDEVHDVQEKMEDIKSIIKGALKEDIIKIKSMIESMQLNFSEHDKRLDYSEQDVDNLKSSYNKLYALIDKTIQQLELKEIIDKVERPAKEEAITESFSQDQVNTLINKIMPQLTRKVSKSRIDRVSRNNDNDNDEY